MRRISRRRASRYRGIARLAVIAPRAQIGLAVLLTALAAAPVFSEEASDSGAGSLSPLPGTVFDKRHLFSLGAAHQTASATLSATARGDDVFQLSLRDLDIGDEDQTYFLEYTYRFAPRWALVAGSFTFSGSGSRVTDRDFVFDGTAFTVGSTIQTALDIDAYIASLMYRVHRSERFELFAGGGIHALDLGAGISGQVRVNESASEFRTASSSLLAPVPNLRAMAVWSLTDTLGLRLNAGWLSANVDEYEGAFTYAHLRMLWAVGKNVGVSLGYQFTDVDIERVTDRAAIAFDVALDGPTLTLNYGF